MLCFNIRVQMFLHRKELIASWVSCQFGWWS